MTKQQSLLFAVNYLFVARNFKFEQKKNFSGLPISVNTVVARIIFGIIKVIKCFEKFQILT